MAWAPLLHYGQFVIHENSVTVQPLLWTHHTLSVYFYSISSTYKLHMRQAMTYLTGTELDSRDAILHCYMLLLREHGNIGGHNHHLDTYDIDACKPSNKPSTVAPGIHTRLNELRNSPGGALIV